jgi:hypothetical protein
VRDMAFLVDPVDDLRRRNGKGMESGFLNPGGQKKSAPVQKKVQLPVMVEIKGGGMIVDIVEDVIHEPLAESQGPVESIPERFGKKEFAADGRNIGRGGERKSEIQRGLLEAFGILAGERFTHGFGSTF